jgi:hypothetical protein
MDRNALKLQFALDKSPDWVCPTCKKGVLRIKKDTFFKEEDSLSRDHSHEAWDPDWITYVYSCLLVCTNDQCKEIVSNVGVGSVVHHIYEGCRGEPMEAYTDFFRPKFFEPPLALINIPDKCPESVSGPLAESFRLFFSVPSAASNNVRIAIEELLTDLKVRKTTLVRGKRRLITLHQRIDLLPTKHANLKDLILAIKWLGNAGSHGNSGNDAITMDDVMDSYELTEHILHEIYAPKTKKLAALAKKVNKKKGPAK